MRRMKPVWILSFVFLFGMVTHAFAEEFVEGKDYALLKAPMPVRDSSKVEVVELFWYGCPHCYTFDPYVAAWRKKQQEDVDFWHSPAVFSKVWKMHAQAFYAAEALGVGEKIHEPLFDAVIKEKRKLTSEDALAKFFAENGVEEAKFKKAYNNFGVKSKVEQAAKRAVNYRITGVPAMIVNGKYRIEPGMAGNGGFPRMLEIVDYLVEKERKTLKK